MLRLWFGLGLGFWVRVRVRVWVRVRVTLKLNPNLLSYWECCRNMVRKQIRVRDIAHANALHRHNNLALFRNTKLARENYVFEVYLVTFTINGADYGRWQPVYYHLRCQPVIIIYHRTSQRTLFRP